MAIDPKPLQSAAPAVSDQVSQHVTVFRANQRHELSMLQTWAVMCRNIWTARELIWQLFKRDFLAGYKKSFLGLTWMFVQPIMGIIPWVFAWKANLYSPGEMDIPFPVYILVGKSMWGVFTAFYQAASATMDAGKALFQQVNFPHDALLIKTTASSLPGLFFTMVTILVVMMAYGVVPSVWGLALPLVMLPLFFLGAAM
ncbi:MAG: hypothetical protein O3A51_08615, partial [Verrucomicrobia bacterium]|nr:hypothetical protein [Verrucomicrobiota bacterium]